MISMCTMVSSTTLLHATALSNTSTSTNYKRTSTSCLATSSCSLYNEPQLTSHMHRHLKRLSSTSCCIYTPARYRSFERESTFLWYQSNIRSSGQFFDRISLLSQRSGKKTRQQRDVVKCAASEEVQTEKPVELPIFPLPLVLFPGAILPLQIFEFRYRIMMHTLLQTDLRFGVVYTDKGAGIAAVGCVGEVIRHERLVDDRFFMICKGQERFRVVNMVRTKPYLVAEVEWLEDRPSPQEAEDVETLASEVEAYMKDVIRLSNRVSGKPDKDVPEDLRKQLFPTPFSFWVGSTFEGAPVEQQALLELEDTAVRLKREKDTLRNTLNYLTAASAVKDAFPSTD